MEEEQTHTLAFISIDNGNHSNPLLQISIVVKNDGTETPKQVFIPVETVIHEPETFLRRLELFIQLTEIFKL